MSFDNAFSLSFTLSPLSLSSSLCRSLTPDLIHFFSTLGATAVVATAAAAAAAATVSDEPMPAAFSEVRVSHSAGTPNSILEAAQPAYLPRVSGISTGAVTEDGSTLSGSKGGKMVIAVSRRVSVLKGRGSVANGRRWVLGSVSSDVAPLCKSTCSSQQ